MLISKFGTTDIDNIINIFEAKYSINFPDQYREFLRKYNGGNTPKSKFKINKISSDIKGFYGLGDINTGLNYSFFEKTHALGDFLEDEVIPIASNSFGDIILIGIGDSNNGKVFFLYHDRNKKYIELTEDFITFLKKCKSEKIGHVKTIEERIESMKAKGYESRIPGLIPVWQAEIDKYADIHQEELILEGC